MATICFSPWVRAASCVAELSAKQRWHSCWPPAVKTNRSVRVIVLPALLFTTMRTVSAACAKGCAGLSPDSCSIKGVPSQPGKETPTASKLIITHNDECLTLTCIIFWRRFLPDERRSIDLSVCSSIIMAAKVKARLSTCKRACH